MTRDEAASIARWGESAVAALEARGFTVVDGAQEDGYQGWGVILAVGPRAWAVLQWTYGSCSGCDAYEDLDDAGRVAEMASLIEEVVDEAGARLLFDSRKGW